MNAEQMHKNAAKAAPKGPYGSKATHIMYHRNGICGVGFYAIHFTFRDDAGDKVAAIGWWYGSSEKSENEGDRSKCAEFYGLVVPGKPDDGYRGDHWVEWFFECAKAYSAAQDAYLAEMSKKRLGDGT